MRGVDINESGQRRIERRIASAERRADKNCRLGIGLLALSGLALAATTYATLEGGNVSVPASAVAYGDSVVLGGIGAALLNRGARLAGESAALQSILPDNEPAVADVQAAQTH